MKRVKNKQNSVSQQMALRIVRGAIREADSLVLVALLGVVADELKERGLSALRQNIERGREYLRSRIGSTVYLCGMPLNL